MTLATLDGAQSAIIKSLLEAQSLSAIKALLAIPDAGGGSDPWTYLKLAADFSISTTAIGDIGLGFTPAANTRYEVEGRLLLRTAATTTGAQPGIAWPTGCNDGVGEISVSTSTTAQVLAFGNINAAIKALGTALPNTTQSWPAYLAATFETGASPSGDFRIQLGSEVAASAVTAKAGSWIKYRVVA